MTLVDALRYAEAHRPIAEAARARLLAAEADADVTRAEWKPRVAVVAEVVGGTVNNSTSSPISNPFVDLPRIGSTPIGAAEYRPYPTTLAAVGARQELYDFGRIAARSAVDAARIDAERARLQGATLDLRFAVATAFVAVLASHGVADVAEQSFRRATAHRDYVLAAQKAGLRTETDVLRAETEASRYEVARLRASRNVALARSAFAAAVGVEAAELEALDDRPSGEEGALAAEGRDGAVAAALTREPQVRAAEAFERAADAEVQAIAAQTRPNLQLSASVSGRAGGGPSSSKAPEVAGAGWLPIVPNYDVGLVFSWPLLDPSVDARTAAARARAASAHATADDVRLAVARRVRDAFERLEIAKDALRALARARDLAVRNSDEANARFRAGLATATELADAEALRAEAAVQFTIGEFQWRNARIELSRSRAEEP